MAKNIKASMLAMMVWWLAMGYQWSTILEGCPIDEENNTGTTVRSMAAAEEQKVIVRTNRRGMGEGVRHAYM